MCPHKSTNTKEGGAFRLREVGLEPEKERDFVCVCFSFVFVYSFVERGCWQHQNHYSLKCLFTLSLFHRVVVKEYYSKVRLRLSSILTTTTTMLLRPIDRSIDLSRRRRLRRRFSFSSSRERTPTFRIGKISVYILSCATSSLKCRLFSLSLFLSPEGKEEREICSTNVALVPFEIVKKD